MTKDRFYAHLDFYRLLEAGLTDRQEASRALGIHRGILWRWKKAYDPEKGPFGAGTDRNICPAIGRGERVAIIEAMRQEALEGN